MQALLDYLRTFIAFRTVAGETQQKEQCLHWIFSSFLAAGKLHPHWGEVRGAPYLFLHHEHPKLLWFGHVDVVPGSEKQFTLQRDGDRAIGRGVKDMKGADLTFFLAYEVACRSARQAPPVSILLTSDEEIGGHTPVALLDDGVIGDVPVAYTPDNGEKRGIVTEMKGAVWMKMTARGKSGHASMPWGSANPIHQLSAVITDLRERFPSGTEDDWRITVTPTQLRGSDAVNKIPLEASCVLDVRFPASAAKNAEQAAKIISGHLSPEISVEIVERAIPLHMDSAHPMVQRVKRIAESVIGQSVPLIRECGSSDARSFCVHDIPAFLYGPVGGDLHGENEWVSITSLEQHVEIHRRLLNELS